MRKLSCIFVILSLLIFQSCYIQRYNQIKKQYEAFKKDYNKARTENTKLKTSLQNATDSVKNFRQNIVKISGSIIRSDSMIEVYTIQIRQKLGEIWGDSLKIAAATGSWIKQISDEERDVMMWLNIARMEPGLFAEMYIDTHLQLYEDKDELLNGGLESDLENNSYYAQSCYLDMKKMQPKNALTFDEKCFNSAKCHATESGKTGYIGHERTGCKEYFSGECCEYGITDGLPLIKSLLLDYGVPSLGHRHICLGNYSVVGISQQPHTGYRVNTVLDFE